ncbi:MAG: hypothetical protein ACTSUE_09115 [Promethearchaeota archaeon]
MECDGAEESFYPADSGNWEQLTKMKLGEKNSFCYGSVQNATHKGNPATASSYLWDNNSGTYDAILGSEMIIFIGAVLSTVFFAALTVAQVCCKNGVVRNIFVQDGNNDGKENPITSWYLPASLLVCVVALICSFVAYAQQRMCDYVRTHPDEKDTASVDHSEDISDQCWKFFKKKSQWEKNFAMQESNRNMMFASYALQIAVFVITLIVMARYTLHAIRVERARNENNVGDEQPVAMKVYHSNQLI